MFYKVRKWYLCLIVAYAIIREVVPLNFLISSSYVSLGVLALGAGLVVWDLFCDRNVFKTKNIAWLFGLIGVYILSSVINYKYGIFGNVKTLGILFVFFFTLYAYGNKRDKNSLEKDFISIFATYNILIGLFVLIGLPMYFFDIGYYAEYFDANSQGYINDLCRLWGVFTEANCAAVYVEVAIISSVWLFTKVKKKFPRVLLVINIVFCFLFVVLAMSHTARLMAIISMFWSALCLVWFKTKELPKLKRIALLIIVPITCSGLLFGVIKGTEKVLPYAKYAVQIAPGYDEAQLKVHKAYDYLYVDIGSIPIVLGLLPPDEPEIPEKDPPVVEELDRVDDDNEDVTHGRLERWTEAWSIYKMSPIFGVTARNVNSFARANSPENALAKYGINVHNSYLEILVSTGAVGMLVFAIFMLLSVLAVVKVVYSEFSLTNILLSAAMIAVAVAGFLHTDLFFIFRLGGVILWMTLGFFALQASKLEEKKD